jgi:hypothetical protein
MSDEGSSQRQQPPNDNPHGNSNRGHSGQTGGNPGGSDDDDDGDSNPGVATQTIGILLAIFFLVIPKEVEEVVQVVEVEMDLMEEVTKQTTQIKVTYPMET